MKHRMACLLGVTIRLFVAALSVVNYWRFDKIRKFMQIDIEIHECHQIIILSSLRYEIRCVCVRVFCVPLHIATRMRREGEREIGNAKQMAFTNDELSHHCQL